MPLHGPLGKVLINAFLPKEHRIEGDINKRSLKATLTEFARVDPKRFAKVVPRIKKIGDEFATFEGISTGLDDIEPEYHKRDPLMRQARARISRAKNDDQIREVLIDTQSKVHDIAVSHPGDMGFMVRTGSRGNSVQLQKAVVAPVVVGDHTGAPVPYLIERGYSEGLSPAEAWIAGDESRSQVIKGILGTSIPGEMQKILSNVMTNQVVTTSDCGTTNGISLNSEDPSLVGRYKAKTNSLITPSGAAALRTRGGAVVVRSPMTCELDRGVCQHCVGTDSMDNEFGVGQNIGIRAAQALSEHLTQSNLSAKHGISLVRGEVEKPRGITAVKQFTEIPKTFFMKATLADRPGTVDSVNKAPQGGYDLRIAGEHHYVPPGRKLKVAQGDSVERGHILSSGVPSPSEIVKFRGLGEGRNYLVGALEDTFKESGGRVDRRHLELLAKSQLNYVQVNEQVGPYLPGEVVPLNAFNRHIADTGSEHRVKDAAGKFLTRSVLHHLPGTELTGSVLRGLRDQGVSTVEATDNIPKAEPYMVSASRTPLLNPNWMQRLGWRYQKKTLQEAPVYGETADLHGLDPYPAIVFGKELKQGPDGSY
jgi:DNA-directed RNA polymerase subunit beta'